jgi:hypothetical protein
MEAFLEEFFEETDANDIRLLDIIHDFKNLQAKIKFVNALPEKYFNKYLERWGRLLSIELINGLDIDKFAKFAESTKVDDLVRTCSYSVLERLVLGDFIKGRDILKQLLDNSISIKKKESMNTRTNYSRLIETILHCENELIDNIDLQHYPKFVTGIVCKYYENRCKLLELECKTKEGIIATLEAK